MMPKGQETESMKGTLMREKTLTDVAFEQQMTFIQIPGPNPIVRLGEDPELWDGRLIEACNVVKDGETYYLYYHGLPESEDKWSQGYRLGVATAPHPMGPWTKYEGNPVLDLGAEDSWEYKHVACAAVLKEKDGTFYMWYSASGNGPWSIGLATAESPLGPWKKHDANPIIKDFAYLGGVVKVDGKYRVYAVHPHDSTSWDQGPVALVVGDRPEGPYEQYKDNPILPAGETGSWDDGGFSEGGILYHEGMYHLFSGGTKASKLESISYAYSFDGYNFIKYSGNPVIGLNSVPDASGYAEVKTLIEPPFIYLYHTLRYISQFRLEDGGWEIEDLAIQVLSTSPTFRIAFPILNLAVLRPRQTSTLKQCCPVSMDNADTCALTTAWTFSGQASAGLRLHIRTSHDGLAWDTRDAKTFDIEAGGSERQTIELAPKSRFFKVLCENLDESAEVSTLNVIATMGR